MRRFDFICGGIDADEGISQPTRLAMDVAGSARNVNLRISDINRTMVSQVPELLVDLLEIAAYVYCGDQRASRGSETLDDTGRAWRRDLRFTIPVRHPQFWQQYDLREALQNTIGFLSDDHYTFEFRQAVRSLPDATRYFDLTQGGMDAEEVSLFSGGIDSLAGALDCIVVQGRKTVLVGHQSAPKVAAAQKELVDRLKSAGHGSKMLYVPVQVTNSQVSVIENTQRSRSFLFASLGFVIATMFGRDRFSFFENGVVSLNLAIAGDVFGARATRTTHPQVIRGFEEIFSRVRERRIEIKTPYLWSTKTEVVERIVSSGFGSLLPESVSCAHPRQWTKEVRHCGRCSQCIDRRFAVLAAGAGRYEPAEGYDVDLLTGPRADQIDLSLAVAYVKFCRNIMDLDRERFGSDYPDLYAATGHLAGLTAKQAVDRFWDLHRRHARSVLSVIETGIRDHAEALMSERLPRGALLTLCTGRTRLDAPAMADMTEQMNDFMNRLQQPVCEFAVDEAGKRILFKGGFVLGGADFRLLNVLLQDHRGAKAEARDVPYFPVWKLAQVLECSPESLRRSISRVRATVIERLTVDYGLVFDKDGFIENERTAGYRLDPRLREVSRADIEAADPMSHGLPQNVTLSDGNA